MDDNKLLFVGSILSFVGALCIILSSIMYHYELFNLLGFMSTLLGGCLIGLFYCVDTKK